MYDQARWVVYEFEKIHTQNLAWCGDSHLKNSRIEFKINGQFF